MNGKFEEKLAQLAFGDLSEGEARQLELEADRDPEARRALMMYKDMRNSLRGLAEIPEDQFSKERLRDAILTQGLKPAPTRPISNRTWLWMPVAACALGFGFVMMRHSFEKGRLNPEIVMGPSVTKTTKLLGISPSIRVAVNNTTNDSRMVHATVASVKHGPSSGRHRSHRHSIDSESTPDLSASWPELTYEGFDPGITHGPAVTAASLPQPTTVASTADNGPIVFIDQDKDALTGAQHATEVGSASNVLVGG